MVSEAWRLSIFCLVIAVVSIPCDAAPVIVERTKITSIGSVAGDSNLFMIGPTLFKIVSYPRSIPTETVVSEYRRRLGPNNGQGGLAVIKTFEDFTFLSNILTADNYKSALIGLRLGRTFWHWIEDSEPVRGQGPYAVLGAEFNAAMLTLSCAKDCISYCNFNKKIIAGFQEDSLKCACFDVLPYDQSCGTVGCTKAQQFDFYAASNDTFDHWATTRPQMSRSCAAISLADGNLWLDRSCDERLPFLCQFDRWAISSMRLDNKACSEDKCFGLFKDRLLNFDDAQKYCADNNGKLLKIDNFKLQLDTEIALTNITSSFLPPLPSPGTPSRVKRAWPSSLPNFIWIGARNTDYVWEDGTLPSKNFIRWDVNQPDRNYDCVAMESTDDGYKWRTRRCDSNNVFVLSFTGVSDPTKIADVDVQIVINNPPTTSTSTSTTSTTQPTTAAVPVAGRLLVDQNLQYMAQTDTKSSVSSSSTNTSTGCDSTCGIWVFLGVVCAIQFIIILILIYFLCCRRRRRVEPVDVEKKKELVNESDEEDESSDEICCVIGGSRRGRRLRPRPMPFTKEEIIVPIIEKNNANTLIIKEAVEMKVIKTIDEAKEEIIESIPDIGNNGHHGHVTNNKARISINGEDVAVISSPRKSHHSTRENSPARIVESSSGAVSIDVSGGGEAQLRSGRRRGSIGRRPRKNRRSRQIEVSETEEEEIEQSQSQSSSDGGSNQGDDDKQPLMSSGHHHGGMKINVNVRSAAGSRQNSPRKQPVEQIAIAQSERIVVDGNNEHDKECAETIREVLKSNERVVERLAELQRTTLDSLHHPRSKSPESNDLPELPPADGDFEIEVKTTKKHHRHNSPVMLSFREEPVEELVDANDGKKKVRRTRRIRKIIIKKSPRTTISRLRQSNDGPPVIIVKRFSRLKKRRRQVYYPDDWVIRGPPDTPTMVGGSSHNHIRHAHDNHFFNGRWNHVDAAYCREIFPRRQPCNPDFVTINGRRFRVRPSSYFSSVPVSFNPRPHPVRTAWPEQRRRKRIIKRVVRRVKTVEDDGK